MKGSDLREWKGTILILLTALISGVSIIVNKFFVVRIDSLLFTAIRALIIGVVFFFISLGISRASNVKFKQTSWGRLILIGIIGGSFAFWLFFSGLKLTTGGSAAFIHKTLPVYAAVLGFIFLREKVSRGQLISMIVMIGGLFLLMYSKISFEARIGDLLVLSATLLWALENTISKKAMINKESNWVVTFGRMFFGSLVLFGIVFLSGKSDLFLSLTGEQILYIAISSLFLFCYVLTWYWGLKYINLSKASSILLLAPVVSLLLGYVWLGEQIFVLQLIGSALILIGGFFMIKSRSKFRR